MDSWLLFNKFEKEEDEDGIRHPLDVPIAPRSREFIRLERGQIWENDYREPYMLCEMKMGWFQLIHVHFGSLWWDFPTEGLEAMAERIRRHELRYAHRDALSYWQNYLNRMQPESGERRISINPLRLRYNNDR